jgi:mannitol/fructose-specific phosphotransferase system IIA component (Ntr-type)
MTGMVAISSIFGDPENEQKFLEATSADEIYDLFISHADAQ